MARTVDGTCRWMVLNQSQSPAFQQLLEGVAAALGPGCLHTGMPHPTATGALVLQSAPPYDRRSVLRRVLSWAAYGLSAAACLGQARGRPFVLAVTNPPFLPQLAWLFHRLRGMPYGLLIWDIYPDHLVKVGWLKQNGLAARLWRALNRRAMLAARVVITLGPGMAAALDAHLGSRPDRCRIEVIPNWADTDFLRPLSKDRNPFALEHGQAGKTTVLYSGNMGATHSLGIVVEAARQLQAQEDLGFLLIGDGLGRRELEASIEAHRLQNVTLLPLQPWSMLPYSLACGDIAVVTQAPGSEHLSVPSKTYSLLAVGCAIVACTDPASDLAALVADRQLGLVCPPGDTEAFVRAIVALSGDVQLLSACRARARQAAVELYSTEAVLARFRHVLAEAMGPEQNEVPL